MTLAAFDEVQLPTNLAAGAKGGPGFSTRVVQTGSGYEYRNAMWSVGLARYNIGHGLKHEADMIALIAFFRARQGKARGFRFKDWSDYQATSQPIFQNPDGDYQLAVQYFDSVNPVTRWISKPVVGTVTFSEPGISLDYTTGICTGGVLDGTQTWSGQFDVPVRFDTDQMEYTTHFFDVLEWAQIPLVEVRIENNI